MQMIEGAWTAEGVWTNAPSRVGWEGTVERAEVDMCVSMDRGYAWICRVCGRI
jgi:hypothetical protein